MVRTYLPLVHARGNQKSELQIIERGLYGIEQKACAGKKKKMKIADNDDC